MRSTRAFVIGVGTAYFFDPRLGRRRRSVARDRGAKAMRQMTRNVGARRRGSRPARRAGLRAETARGRRPATESDDAIVEQRIRSDALRDVGVSTRDIEIGVEDGVVTLTGEVVGDKRASDLVARIGKVPGVENVAAMLHVVPSNPTTGPPDRTHVEPLRGSTRQTVSALARDGAVVFDDSPESISPRHAPVGTSRASRGRGNARGRHRPGVRRCR